MARQPRLEFEGALYHVLSRGDRREDIALDDDDRQRFREMLARACAKCDWQVHAWVLMSNHFHLVIETPHGNLATGMKWLLGTYTMAFNRRHRLVGHLFAGRYKSLLIDDSSPQYLRVACDYVHLNPARARIIGSEQRLESFAWSSYPDYLASPVRRPVWLRVDRLFGEHGLRGESRHDRLEFSRRCEALRLDPDAAGDDAMRSGWHYGAEDFLVRLLDRLEGQVNMETHPGRERLETAAAQAEAMIARRLAELHWTENDLRRQPKCSVEKLELAASLREVTTMSVREIADRLSMGARSNLSKLLYEKRKSGNPTD